MFNKLLAKKDTIDEVKMKRLKKDAKSTFSTIVLGNGVIDYQKIKCTKCGNVFEKFNMQYSSVIDKIVPACDKCGVDIFTSEFLPLDQYGNLIKM
jgi:NAD-dependent SIR2 family protein deacetylase